MTKLPKFITRLLYRFKNDNKVNHITFRGSNHAIKAAAFVVNNKNSWDHYIISSDIDT